MHQNCVLTQEVVAVTFKQPASLKTPLWQPTALNHFDSAFSALPMYLEAVLKTLKAGTVFMVKKSPEAAKQVGTSFRKGLFR